MAATTLVLSCSINFSLKEIDYTRPFTNLKFGSMNVSVHVRLLHAMPPAMLCWILDWIVVTLE